MPLAPAANTTVSAINQAVFGIVRTAVGSMLATNALRLDPVTGQPMPAIFNDCKVRTPDIYPQVTFVIVQGLRLRPFRTKSPGAINPCMTFRYFMDLEVWSQSLRQDSQEGIIQPLILGLEQEAGIDINQFDPLSYCWDCSMSQEIILSQWREEHQAYRSLLRWSLTAGRGG